MDSSSERVLVVTPHPDDADFGCSGAAATWAQEGVEVFYLLCTSGEKGSPREHAKPEEFARIREEEQKKAAKILGLKEVIFLRLPDGELQNSPAFRKELVRQMRRLRPSRVLTLDPANRSFDNQFLFHSDHRATAEAVFDAVYPAVGNRNYFPELEEEGLRPHHIPELFFFGTAQPNVWIDISSTIDLKIRALKCHASQLGEFKEIDARVRERFREVGSEKGLPYAESFRRLEIIG